MPLNFQNPDRLIKFAYQQFDLKGNVTTRITTRIIRLQDWNKDGSFLLQAEKVKEPF